MKNPFSKMSGGEMIAHVAKFVIAVVVIIFLGIQSINFFNYIFPADQQIYSMLGFGLTGGGVMAYLLVLKFTAKSRLDKVVAACMLVICILGELATAGFGMQVEALSRQGIVFTKSDLDGMIWAIRILGFVHAVALVAMVGGVEFAEAFQSDAAPSSSYSPPAPSYSPSAPFPVPSPVNRNQLDAPALPQVVPSSEVGGGPAPFPADQ